MRTITTLIALIFCAQFSIAQKSKSPYVWNWKKDGLWTGAAVAGTAGGLYIIGNKEGFSEAEITQKINAVDDINFADRWVAGKYNSSASDLSDIPFALSFAAPFALLFDKNANDHSGQLFGIYFESLTTTAALFTITAGVTRRARPYVYSPDFSLERKKNVTATRSFYSGHVAATATATFFGAKVFQDFNPDSKAVPYVWAGAAIVPATVGYLRLEAGQHFLTDVLLGYTMGALVGYWVPELHKKEDSKFSFAPVMSQNFYGENYQALSFKYEF
jgi:membrane-associated phospholipid phosphatase